MTLFSFLGCKRDVILVSQDQIIKLIVTSDTANLKADGIALINLKVQLPAGFTDDFKIVTFSSSTNLGTFLSSSNSNNNIVAADANGGATTTIKVGTIPGIYYISAQVGIGANIYKTPDIPITLMPLAFKAKLTLSVDNTTPLADNLTIVNLTVTSKYETDKTIKLISNLGNFSQSSTPTQYNLPLDGLGNGTTQFQISNSMQPHTINASFADGTSATVTLNPIISRPDTIFAEPSGLMVDTLGSPVSIKVFLFKNNTNAKVSINTLASYYAYKIVEGNQVAVGRFTGLSKALSDAEGAVSSVNFYGDTGDIIFGEKIYIEISALTTATTKTVTVIKLKLK